METSSDTQRNPQDNIRGKSGALHISSLFGDRSIGGKSERDVIVGDLFNFFKDRNIKLLRTRTMNYPYFGTLLAPIPTDALYVLHGKIKQAKNPAAMFWYHVRYK